MAARHDDPLLSILGIRIEPLLHLSRTRNLGQLGIGVQTDKHFRLQELVLRDPERALEVVCTTHVVWVECAAVARERGHVDDAAIGADEREE